jgi:beta-galactosidase
VENAGRINYGAEVGERKGLGQVQLMGEEGHVLEQAEHAWTIVPLHWHKHEVEALPWTQPQMQSTPATTLRVARGSFKVQDLSLERDTYIDTRGWGRGAVFLNGINLGRFDGDGPQFHLYVPGCWLVQGHNELVVLDMRRETSITEVHFAAEPIWHAG